MRPKASVERVCDCEFLQLNSCNLHPDTAASFGQTAKMCRWDLLIARSTGQPSSLAALKQGLGKELQRNRLAKRQFRSASAVDLSADAVTTFCRACAVAYSNRLKIWGRR